MAAHDELKLLLMICWWSSIINTSVGQTVVGRVAATSEPLAGFCIKDDTYMYVADEGQGLRVIDWSGVPNSASPTTAMVNVGSWGSGYDVRACTVAGNRLYVSGALATLQVLDISTPTSPSPVSVSVRDTSYGNSRVLIKHPSADIIYSCVSSGIAVYDTSTTPPTAIQYVQYSSRCYDMALRGAYLHVATSNYLIYVVDPTSRQLSGPYDTNMPGPVYGLSLWPDGSRAYVTSSNYYDQLDTSTPSSVNVLSKQHTHGSLSVKGIACSGTLCFSTTSTGVLVIDSLDLPSYVNHAEFPLSGDATYVTEIRGTLLFASVGPGGLYVVNIANLPYGIPVTDVPDTAAPDTPSPPTVVPDTAAPSTPFPATGAPDTAAPDTPFPATVAPDTLAPNTPAPDTPAPDTPAPNTPAPDTPAPNTPAPDTPAPNTPAPNTPAPDTPAPDTPAPNTPAPDTPAPDTPAPDTPAPDTPVPDTPAPDTPAPDTPAPDTPAPDTPAPGTPAPTTPAPDTPAPDTPAPNTPAPDTPAPDTPAPDTPAPNTPAPDTPAPNTAAPITPFPLTGAPDTPAPDTPAPSTLSPPTAEPTSTPTMQPSSSPNTLEPTASPTQAPSTVSRTATPTSTPTKIPTAVPTAIQPTVAPTTATPATAQPTAVPTVTPTVPPTIAPTGLPPPTDNSTLIPATDAPEVLANEEAISTAGSAAAVGSVAAAGAAAGAATRLVVVSLGCNLHGKQQKMPRALHPTQMEIWGSESVGLVVGNFAITFGFGLLCFVLVKIAMSGGAKMFPRLFNGLDTQGWMRFPSAPLVVFQLFYQGTTLGSINLIIQPPNAGGFILGIVSLAVCIVVPFIVFYIVTKSVPGRAVYMHEFPCGEVRKLMLGPGEWVNTDRSCFWVQRYTSVVRTFGQDTAWYALIEFAASLTISAIQAAETDSYVGCGHKKVFTGVIFFSMLLLEAKLWPHARFRDSTLDFVMLGLQGVAMFMMAAGHYHGKGVDDKEFILASDLMIIAVVLLLIKVGLDVCTEVYILVTGRRSRLQTEIYDTCEVEGVDELLRRSRDEPLVRFSLPRTLGRSDAGGRGKQVNIHFHDLSLSSIPPLDTTSSTDRSGIYKKTFTV